jgi:hypothetical protein
MSGTQNTFFDGRYFGIAFDLFFVYQTVHQTDGTKNYFIMRNSTSFYREFQCLQDNETAGTQFLTE